ncbi:hypothetical protein SE17_18670 [Kouleothrix aurantiaca]|uniref:N-acetyltransferase domain-containing protein n=1 Tax=Kouleothrix aurantiaca TaxID=186479 RepID=A0A0P9HBS2_9CHLR|nr:hypothetical protein SE17_18670 [Kouleothrix aurantiaca]
MAVTMRPAVADDQDAIRMIIRASMLNPLGLEWSRFLVVEESGGLIGIGQVKPHRGGMRELASIAVVPEWQGNGVGAAIVRALLSRETGPIYLMCARPTRIFYERFGFQEVRGAQIPGYFRPFALMGALVSRLSRSERYALAVMRRDPQP